MKKRSILLVLVFIISSSFVFSHVNSGNYNLNSWSLYPVSNWTVLGYGSLVFGLVIVYIVIFNKKMKDTQKRVFFYLLILISLSVTLYLVLTTVHLNLVADSKGPVHWHADYELWGCDKEYKLFTPKGMSNRQGVDVLHSHDDNRIHVEGVLMDLRSASLGAFFQAIGGGLSSDGMAIPTNDGLVTFHEGDLCNGQPGKLYLFVNGKLEQNPPEHIVAAFEQVPPGDKIKLIFTEKPLEQINPNIK